jgi:hypothetical protein
MKTLLITLLALSLQAGSIYDTPYCSQYDYAHFGKTKEIYEHEKAAYIKEWNTLDGFGNDTAYKYIQGSGLEAQWIYKTRYVKQGK